ncbi:hypothetical protein TEU_10825 [Thermococcus eurythermalis]|uniref:Uncharacterized protein n=1 Tax=Thermococcus eurythermalis TaxID=1505907 RepID=A0A097QWG1_9EURY|nr:hypothetical protein [Thermococcus eurythermalis]AIU70786.1 hypothetical protein TEU_10825 [Thermococcus eurythermalis]
MVSKRLKNAVGFVLLGTASLTFLEWADQFNDFTFALAIAYVLLAFAWMDFAKLVIYVFLAFGAIAGFFLGNLKALFYATPVGLAYLLFGVLMDSNREKLATAVFVLSIPLLIINSKFFPQASIVSWGLIGLMAGVIENAVIEEMAEGDVFIISLYFMALGPFAFIPLAFQFITGLSFYERDRGYPVGPAMFIIAVPVFMLIYHLLSNNALPEWLFYGYYHGVTNERLAILGALGGTFGIPYLMADYSKHSSPSGEPDDFKITLAGGTMGAVAGLIAGLLALVAVAAIGVYLDDMGYHNISTIVVLLALVAAFFAGMAAFAFTSQLHYEGKSSVDWHLWFWGISIVAIVLSLYLLPKAWKAFPEAHHLALFTGLLALVMFYLSIEKAGGPYSLVDRLWQATLYSSAFLAGVWAGLGAIWILH